MLKTCKSLTQSHDLDMSRSLEVALLFCIKLFYMEDFTCIYCYVALEERSTEAVIDLDFSAFQYFYSYFTSNKR